MLDHRLRRWPNIKPTLVQSPNVGLMLDHRLRRWPNIKPTLVQSPMFAGWVGLAGHTRALDAHRVISVLGTDTKLYVH